MLIAWRSRNLGRKGLFKGVETVELVEAISASYTRFAPALSQIFRRL